MASDRGYVEYICEQLHPLGKITYRQMMGEYIVYVNGKYVLTVADNEVYLKPTSAVIPLLNEVIIEPFYDGGKPAYLIRDVDDSDYLCDIVLTTYHALP